MHTLTSHRLDPFGVELHTNSLEELLSVGIKQLVVDHQLLLIRGIAPLSGKAFLEFVETLAGGRSGLLKWDFGYLMELRTDPGKENYIFPQERVPLHWDGAFHNKVPSTLTFQCIKTRGEGGETNFCHTTNVWNQASKKERQILKHLIINLKAEKKAYYGGVVREKIVGTHPHTGKPILRFTEPVDSELNPVEVKLEGPQNPEDWITSLKERLYESRNCYSHKWEVGDIVFADNHALLHGRNAYKNASRLIHRVQLL